MKSKEEILKRAVVLLTFSDRCALEKEIVGGARRTLNEREVQRQAIVDWLIRMEYYDSALKNEKQIFNIPITNTTNKDILLFQNNYECIEPMMWSLGLVSELSKYDDYVLYDFHPVLKFGKNHSFNSLLRGCNMVPYAKIEDFRELSMLWYWRCLEYRNGLSVGTDIIDAVSKIFGDDHVQLLYGYSQFDSKGKDFVIKGKRISELDEQEINKLLIISERRFHAFEWLSSDLDWDNVDLVC